MKRHAIATENTNRVQKRWRHKKLFLHFSVLDTMYGWSMMKNIHSPNLVGIGSWGPEIWPHEYLICPIEISVNWPGSKHLWTRPIYTDFNGANYVFMWPYLGPPWTNSCQIWCVRVFHHVLLKYGHENAEICNKRKFDDVTLQYSIQKNIIHKKRVFLLCQTNCSFKDCRYHVFPHSDVFIFCEYWY